MSAYNRSITISPFARKASTLFSGNLAGQIVPIIVAPILSRLYAPEEFGIFSLYLSIVGIGAVVSTCRYEFAILLPRRPENADALLALAFLLVLGVAFVSLIVCMGVYVLRDPDPSNLWILAIPLAIFVRGITQSLLFAHTRRENYGLIAISKVAQGLVMGLGQVVLGLKGWAAGGLVLGSFMAYLSAASISCAGARDWITAGYHQRFAKIVAVARRYKEFPKFNLPHAGLRVATVNLPLILLGIHFSEEAVGYYAMCYGVTVLPLSLLSQSLFQVFSQELAREWKERSVAVVSRAVRLLQRLCLISALPFAVSVIIAPAAFSSILGEQWRESGELYRFLSPMIVMSFVSSVFSFVPQLLGRQRRALHLEAAGFLMMILSIGVGGGLWSLSIALSLFSVSAAALTAYRLYWYFSLLKQNAAAKV